jgi:hypothetical protein
MLRKRWLDLASGVFLTILLSLLFAFPESSVLAASPPAVGGFFYFTGDSYSQALTQATSDGCNAPNVVGSSAWILDLGAPAYYNGGYALQLGASNPNPPLTYSEAEQVAEDFAVAFINGGSNCVTHTNALAQIVV